MDRKAILITIFSLFVLTLKVQSAITRRELLDNLTSVSTYDQSYPSGYDENIQCGVIVQLEISDVTSISEQNMEYSLMMFLRMQWRDSRLAFYDVANFTRIDLTGDMVDLIWKPDLYISNERKVDPHSFVKHEELAYIDPNGTVTFSMRVSMTGNCHMDLNLYPFDVQTCNVKLQSYAFTSDKLLFQWSKNGILTSHFDLANYEVDVGENLEGLEPSNDRSLAGGEFSFLITGVKFKRRSNAYGSMYFAPFPIFFVIAMCSFGFKDQMGPRVALCTTGLSATLLQWIAIYSRLPPVWYFTFLDGWILFHICMVGAILIFQAIWYKFFNESTIKNELERDGFAMFLYIYALVCVALLVTWSGSNRLWIIFVVIPGLTFLLTIIDVIVLAKNGYDAFIILIASV
ncbi:glycine receptor subunit alpha-2-like [Ruditapes philippinarum]|uniref:glycine receptor subunit alpha-2-like n=1 Tax=Ruditapes philippinarum TaxID=129788 RepID=UPI00295B0340|nr:glycine receptor subunit alpha-2-like [Ruditapes philippinarum]